MNDVSTSSEKRTGVGQALSRTQVDKVRVAFTRASSIKGEGVSQLKELIASVFKAYKEAQLHNDTQVNMLSSMLLLRNLASTRRGFVSALKQRRKDLLSVVVDAVEELVVNDGYGQSLYDDADRRFGKKSVTRTKDTVMKEVLRTVEDLLDGFDLDGQKDEDSTVGRMTSREYLSELRQRLDRESSAITEIARRCQFKSTKKDVNQFTKSVFLTIFDSVSVIGKSSKGRRGRSVQQSIVRTAASSSDRVGKSLSRSLDTTVKYDVQGKGKGKSSRRRNTRRKRNVSKTPAMTAVADIQALGGIVTNDVNGICKRLDGISDSPYRKGLLLGMSGVGLMWAGRSALGLVTSGVGKLVGVVGGFAKGVIGFVKGVTADVVGTVAGVVAKAAKPIIPQLVKFLATPGGAFAAGYIAHAVCHTVKKAFSSIFDKEQVGDAVGSVWLAFRDFFRFIRRIPFDKMMRTVLKVGNDSVIPLLREFVAGVLPERIRQAALEYVAGSAAGWASYKMFGKQAGKVGQFVQKAFRGAIGKLGVGGSLAMMMWGAFLFIGAKMSEQIARAVNTASEKQNYLTSGQHYADLFKNGSARSKGVPGMGGDFLRRNASAFEKYRKVSGEVGKGKTESGIRQLILDAVDSGQRREALKREQDEIDRFCAEERGRLSDELQGIKDASRSEDDEQKRSMAFPITVVYNGTALPKSCNLPKNTSNPIEVRSRNLLTRAQALADLNARKYRDQFGKDGAKGEISHYRELVDGIVRVDADGKGTVDTKSVTGHDLKTYSADNKYGPIRRDGKATQNFFLDTMSKDLAYYAIKENKGNVNWNDADKVEQTLNYGIGKTVQDASPSNGGDDIMGVKHDVGGGRTITAQHYEELCSIFLDMFCGSQTNIVQNVKQRFPNIQRAIAMVCSSSRLNGKVKYKAGDAKQQQFVDVMFAEGSKLRKMFMDVFRSRVDMMVSNTMNMRIVSSRSQRPTDGAQLVTVADVYNDVTDSPFEFEMYRYVTYEAEKWRGGQVEWNKSSVQSGKRDCHLVSIGKPLTENHRDDELLCIYSQYRRDAHDRVMDGIGNSLKEILVPLFDEYANIENTMRAGSDMTGTVVGDSASKVMQAFSGLQRDLSDRFDAISSGAIDALDVSQERVERESRELERLKDEVKERGKRLIEKIRGDSENAKDILNKASGGRVDQELGDVPSAGGGDVKTHVVHTKNNHNIRTAIVGARNRCSAIPGDVPWSARLL